MVGLAVRSRAGALCRHRHPRLVAGVRPLLPVHLSRQGALGEPFLFERHHALVQCQQDQEGLQAALPHGRHDVARHDDEGLRHAGRQALLQPQPGRHDRSDLWPRGRRCHDRLRRAGPTALLRGQPPEVGPQLYWLWHLDLAGWHGSHERLRSERRPAEGCGDVEGPGAGAWSGLRWRPVCRRDVVRGAAQFHVIHLLNSDGRSPKIGPLARQSEQMAREGCRQWEGPSGMRRVQQKAAECTAT
mmetsp:Transcript_66165/g.171667  ORF Transcript_66165/g.171667 Transcript_66165/m.171667 type:complete len:244 (-) Transcript_66165:563-1294(-)